MKFQKAGRHNVQSPFFDYAAFYPKSRPKLMVNNTRLIKVAGAVLLSVASLALLAPALSVSAGRDGLQQQKPVPDTRGVAAPMQPIRPVSVAVVNFEELAKVEAKRQASGIKEEPELVEIHPPLTIPEPDEPVGSAPAVKQSPQSQGEAGGPLIPSPAAAASFVAQLDEVRVGASSRSIPPDTTGAVGLTKIMSVLNTNYRIQNKADGAVLSTVASFVSSPSGDTGFWAPLNTPTPAPPVAPVAGVFDPRIQYDPYNGRWIVAAISNSRTASASVLVGISATSDPEGTFTLFRFVVGCAAGDMGCDADGEWADFPMLGFNKNWVAVGWNQFDSASSSTFVAGKMLVLDYPSLRSGTVNSMIFTVTGAAFPNSQNFCMHPATTYSSTEEKLYVPAHFSSATARYQLHEITGTPASPTYTVDTVAKTRPGGGWVPTGGNILPQTCVGTPGTTCPTTLRKIDSGDTFIRSNVVFRNCSIWYAQTIGLPASGLTHTAVQWTRIDTNGNFVDGGRIDDPTATGSAGEWYAYPSIAINANNDVLVGYSNFSATHLASAGYSFRAGTDAAGTIRDPTIFKAGEDYYAKDFAPSPSPSASPTPTPRNRWGDFSHTVVDPTNDLDMWTIQEFAGTRTVATADEVTNNSRWGTWWAKVSTNSSSNSVSFSSAAFSVNEGVDGNGLGFEGTGSRTITVTRSGADLSGAARVDFATSEGTADERRDYTKTRGTLRFASGETSKSFVVLITDDVFKPGDMARSRNNFNQFIVIENQTETVNLTLSNPVGTSLGATPTAVLTINDNDSVTGANPVRNETLNSRFFVRQQYMDFFGREPDLGGLNFWSGGITVCGGDLNCRKVKSIDTSAAFFLSIEFQETGFLVHRTYKAAFGDINPPIVPAPARFNDFLSDTRRIGEGVIVGVGNWQEVLENNKVAFFEEFVIRPQFLCLYPLSMTADAFVDAINTKSGTVLSPGERDALVSQLQSGQKNRAQVLRAVAEDATMVQNEFNRSFVLMQYFGYLRRNPDDPQDTNFNGFNFWLNKLNQFNGDFRAAEMVKAFIESIEYVERFGP